MAEESEYWLPPYWDASELFLVMGGKTRQYELSMTEDDNENPPRGLEGISEM